MRSFIEGVIMDAAERLTRAKGVFVFDTLTEEAKKHSGFDEAADWEMIDELEAEFERGGHGDIVPVPGTGGFRFFRRDIFFERAEFLVRPMKYEIDNGILIAGHRFIPFFDEADFAAVRLTDPSGGGTVKAERVMVHAEQVKLSCGMLCVESWISDTEDMSMDEAEAEAEKILDTVSGEDMKISLRAHMLGDFYKRSGFTDGDFIKVTVTSHSRKECSVARVPGAGISPVGTADEWTKAFLKGLEKAVKQQKKNGGQFTNGNLLAAAFFHAGAGLTKNPRNCFFRALFSQGCKFSLQTGMDAQLLIWEKDKLHGYIAETWERESFEEDEELMDAVLDGDYEGMAHFMGYDVSVESLEACMLSARCSGKGLDEVKKRCFDDRVMLDYPDMEEAFDQAVEGIWRGTENAPAWKMSPEIENIRAGLLELKDLERGLIRRIEKLSQEGRFSLEDLLSPEFDGLRRLAGIVDASLAQVTGDVEPKGKTADILQKTLENLREGIRSSIKIVENRFMR
jgi:hypothetical protein